MSDLYGLQSALQCALQQPLPLQCHNIQWSLTELLVEQFLQYIHDIKEIIVTHEE